MQKSMDYDSSLIEKQSKICYNESNSKIEKGIYIMNDFTIENGILKKYQGNDTHVTIPEGVTVIGSYAFNGCKSIESITIPDGVTKIGAEAFSYCGSLQSITIPKSVTQIGRSAFFDCHNLSKINLPDSITSVDNGTFNSCKNLQSITIPNSVTSIGDWAFNYCTKLKSIFLPDSVTAIGTRAFSLCENLQDIVIPHNVTSIGTSAFQGCKKLKNMQIPDSITSVGDSLFCFCDKLENVTLSSSVWYIGHNMFAYCSKLQSIDIPETVNYIGRLAFKDCSALKSLHIPEGVTFIGAEAFSGCNGLQSLRIPNGVKEITECSLNCPNLKELDIPAHLQIKAKTFGNALPVGLIPQIEKLYPQMADGVIKQYVLQKEVWEQLSLELQTEIFLSRQAKTLLPVYGTIINEEQAEFIGKKLLEKAEEKLSVKECNTIASFMSVLCPKASVSLLQSLYRILESQKNGAKALKSLTEDSILMEKIGQQTEIDENIPEPEKKVLNLLKNKSISSKNAEDFLKKYYGLTPSDLPNLKYKDGSDASFLLIFYLLTAHEGLKESVNSKAEVVPAYPKPGVSPEAQDILSYLDPKSLQDALLALSQKNLGISGHTKKMFLAYPICRYASEDLMHDLTKHAPSWSSSVSGIEAPPLRTFRKANAYSETRSAMLFADRYHELNFYATLRGIDEDFLRDKYLSDVGLSENGTKLYDLGNQTVTAVLQNDFSFIILLENGKTAKSLPKKSADTEKYTAASADFTEMKKSVKKILKNRRDILFSDFLSDNSRSAKSWLESYTKNPLLRSVASILVWEQAKNTFILTEKGAITSNGEPYAIDENQNIRIAHPMEMESDDLSAWQKYFTSNGLKQPFEQIWEPVIDESEIQEERYAGCKIPFYRFKGHENHGIFVKGGNYEEEVEFSLKDCAVDVERIDWNFFASPNDCFEIKSFSFINRSRASNHIAAYLDRVTIYERILKDDITIEQSLQSFTLAQITDFIDFASRNQCTSVTALLLEYKNKKFADFDPMDIFSLDF